MAERIDSLHLNGYSIIQNKEYFCYGVDAVLLADFAFKNTSQNAGLVVDLCTGNAIVPILMKATQTLEPNPHLAASRYIGIELQPVIADMAARSLQLNGFQNEVTILQADIKNLQTELKEKSIQIVTCNPPYMQPHKGRQSSNLIKMIARQELECNLKDVFDCVDRILSPEGQFFMVHRPERLQETEELCASKKMSIRRLCKVLPQEGSAPTMLLFEIRPGISTEKAQESTVVIYNPDRTPTRQINRIYRRN